MYVRRIFSQVKRELKPYSFIFRAAVVVLISPLFLHAQKDPAPAPAAPAATSATPVAPAPAAAPAASATPDEPAVTVTKEDWTHLPVDAANFKLLAPALGAMEEKDKFTREFIQLGWRDGDPVEVYVILPKGVTNPPVVLYLYGYHENLDRFKNDEYCERLTAGGYAAVGFEPALGIDRIRSGRPMKDWFVSELQEALGSSVHDVQMVLNYLDTRHDLDLNRVGIFGRGSGGAIAILAAATDSRLKVVDTLNPWGDWSDWLAKSSIIPEAERPSYLKPEFLDKVKSLEPMDWMPKVKASAVRLQFIGGDTSIPPTAADRMAEAASHQKIFTVTRYKDAQDLYQQNDGGKLYDWIKARLRTNAAAKPETRLETNSAETASTRADATR
jgi:acetyl esterase/lipase